MAWNKVPVQKGLSEDQFDDLYGTEENCRPVVFSWRWPSGFECPGCGGFATGGQHILAAQSLDRALPDGFALTHALDEVKIAVPASAGLFSSIN
jgi:hypothetical protein